LRGYAQTMLAANAFERTEFLYCFIASDIHRICGSLVQREIML